MAIEIRHTAELVNTASGEPVIRVVRGHTIVNVSEGEAGEATEAMVHATTGTLAAEVGEEFGQQLVEWMAVFKRELRKFEEES